MTMSHWKDFLDPEARGGRYLPWKEVARATGLSRTTAWRLQKRDDFPAPYAISPGRVAYREQEVEAWRVSRDHSGARPRPRPDSARPPPATAAESLPAMSPRPHATTPTTAPAAPDPPAAAEAEGAPKLDGGPPTARRGTAVRRRSEHARAIAHQMLFDF
jgi:prophage regulatory protein